MRSNDGADQAQIPYTGGNNPGEYRITTPGFPGFNDALLPGWGSVTPFSPDVPARDPNNPTARLQQFGLNGPPAFGSQEFVDQENFVRQIGGFQNTDVTTITRTADQTNSALFWSLDRLNGMGFRAIERSTGVDHTTIIYWLKQIGEQLPDAQSRR